MKPQNVLIDPDGRAKVTDFGIARSLEAQGLTATGRVLGTTDYVSPEQALGDDVTEQSDVYSLGIVLYEMLTGEAPVPGRHPGGGRDEARARAAARRPAPAPEISAALAAVVERATAKETENRYASVGEMVARPRAGARHRGRPRGRGRRGEATTVLRSLPGDTADFAPCACAIPARAIALGCRARDRGRRRRASSPRAPRRGTGGAGHAGAAAASSEVQLRATRPTTTTRRATRRGVPERGRTRSTGSPTPTGRPRPTAAVRGRSKDGVGIVRRRRLRRRGRRLDLVTHARLRGRGLRRRTTVPEHARRLGQGEQATETAASAAFKLDTAGARSYRHYLVWITELRRRAARPDPGAAALREALEAVPPLCARGASRASVTQPVHQIGVGHVRSPPRASRRRSSAVKPGIVLSSFTSTLVALHEEVHPRQPRAVRSREDLHRQPAHLARVPRPGPARAPPAPSRRRLYLAS